MESCICLKKNCWTFGFFNQNTGNQRNSIKLVENQRKSVPKICERIENVNCNSFGNKFIEAGLKINYLLVHSSFQNLEKMPKCLTNEIIKFSFKFTDPDFKLELR